MTSSILRRLAPPVNVAHRGGSQLWPENTLLALTEAVRLHACPLLEIDVHATSDGVLVVHHDDTLDRTTNGTGALAKHTLAEVKALDAADRFAGLEGDFPYRGREVRVPTLREVLDALPETYFNIDVKPDRPELAPLLAKTVGGALDRVCVGSEHDATTLAVREAMPEATWFMSRNELMAAVPGLMQGETIEAPAPVLHVPLTFQGMRIPTPALLEAAWAQELWVFVWTVDEVGEMKQLVADGVAGIITDRPDRLAAVLGHKA